MEDRFLVAGKELAQQIVEDNDIELTEQLVKVCQSYKWNWYCAEMSDDYSKTLREQHQLNEDLQRYIKSCSN